MIRRIARPYARAIMDTVKDPQKAAVLRDELTAECFGKNAFVQISELTKSGSQMLLACDGCIEEAFRAFDDNFLLGTRRQWKG